MSRKQVGLFVVGVLCVVAFAPVAMAGTVGAARAATSGTPVSIEGAVISSTTDLINSSNSKCFQIQDSTGGITVYGQNAFIEALLAVAGEGDEITITGTTGTNAGLAELFTPFTITKTGSPGIPTPITVATADFQDFSATAESLESKLVVLSNVQIQATGNFAYNVNYVVSDGVSSTILRVSTTTLDLVGQPIPTGLVSIVGIFSQYDSTDPRNGGYQLLVRKMADITSVSGNAPPTSTSKSVLTQKDMPVMVTLDVVDPDGPDPLSIKIVSLPANGTLTDAYDSHLIVSGDLPYTLSGGAEVTYQPTTGFHNLDSFTFRGADGTPADGNIATISFLVQDTTVVMTEIMYDPKNSETSPTNYWEWVEIYNAGDSAVDLGGFANAFTAPVSTNLSGSSIPAGEIRIIARGVPDTIPPANPAFLAEWGLPEEAVIFVAYTDWPTLANSTGSDLYLSDSAGALLDVVYYREASPWPGDTGNSGKDIYVMEGYATTIDNDDGGNWLMSEATVDGAIQSPGGDIGSPLYIPGITTGNQPPFASSQTLWTGKGGSWDVTLGAMDDGLPSDTLNFVVDTLPLNGTLTDVDNGNVAITTVPYAIPNQMKKVRYTNNGTCGDDTFTFHATDTLLDSGTGTVTIWVECGDLIITEVMYNPASAESSGVKPTEWLEVYNTTESPIDASSWYITKGVSGAANRSGDWPSGSIIPAHGVAVIVAPGTLTSPGMTPEAFRTAWDGYTVPVIIVPSSTNDSASGNLASGGLTNAPVYPGEMVRIIDLSGKVQDIVSYQDGSGWPSATGESSIYLKTGSYDAASNDVPGNWANSRDCAGGAYGSAVVGFWDKTDFGSPGFLDGVTAPTGNIPPSPLFQRAGVLMDTPKTITLTYCDDGNPTGGPVSFTLTAGLTPSLPTNGTLTDPGNSHVIVSGDLPYTLVNNGNAVLYTPNTGYTSVFGGPDGKTSTDDAFTFAVNDGAKASRSDGKVTIIVQKGGLIISEIMYDPAHLNYDPVTGDSDWEWIEVTNTTGSAITLNKVTDDLSEPDAKFTVSTSIPAGATRILTKGDNATRTQTDFLTAWAPIDPAIVIFVNALSWETLNNTGNRLQLIDESGNLLDDVLYLARSPWPLPANGPSIYVKSGKLSAIDNDQGGNWALSAVGVDNAFASVGTPTDVGSPGLLPVACVPPTVTSIAPAQADQGQSLTGVTIGGTNFVAGATVKLTRTGQTDINATSVTVDSATQITCSIAVPSGAEAGTWNVVVTTCDVGTLPDGFTVNVPCAAPTVSAISPNTGVQGTGNRTANPPGPNTPLYTVAPGPVHATITGTNFVAGATVKLVQSGKADLVATNVVVVNPTTITADIDLGGVNDPAFPPGSLDGAWDVVVTTCAEGTLPGGFTVSMCFSPRVDTDGDGSVDLAVDFTIFRSCFNGIRPFNGPPIDQRKCSCLDADPVGAPNGTVDLLDFAKFRNCFNGPNRAPAGACGL